MGEGAPVNLTEKELRFCREYCVEPNAVQAYLRAYGRTEPNATARKSASVLLTKPHIQAEIRAARREYMRRVGLTAERVLRGMVEIAFADPDDCYDADPQNGGLPTPRPWDEIPPATRRAMQGVKVKRKKLKQLGKEGQTEAVAWELEEVEYKFPDKNAMFDKLCRHLGLTKGEFQEAAESLLKVLDLTGDKPPPPSLPAAGG